MQDSAHSDTSAESAAGSGPRTQAVAAPQEHQQSADLTPKRGQHARLRLSVLAVGAIGLVAIALMFIMGSLRVSQPSSHIANAEQTAQAPAAHADPIVLTELRPPWVVRRHAVSAYDGTKILEFTLDSSNDLPSSVASARPQLVVRCSTRQFDVYVATGPLAFERQSATHSVGVQMDTDPEQLQQWLPSESSQEVFAPDGLDFVQRLARARRMRFTYVPFRAKSFTADFVVEGLDQLAPQVARTCGKRLDTASQPRPAGLN